MSYGAQAKLDFAIGENDDLNPALARLNIMESPQTILAYKELLLTIEAEHTATIPAGELVGYNCKIIAHCISGAAFLEYNDGYLTRGVVTRQQIAEGEILILKPWAAAEEQDENPEEVITISSGSDSVIRLIVMAYEEVSPPS